MANKVQVVTLRGRVMYAKVLGEPVPNYNKDGREWKLDFIPNDAKSAKVDLKGLGVADRLRTRTNKQTDEAVYDGAPHLSFKQSEFKADGSPNSHIEVKDILGADWPQDKLIGNDTVVDMRFAVIDYGPGRLHGVYPRSIRVLDHKPFEQKSFTDVAPDDEYYLKAQEAAKAAEIAEASVKVVEHDTFKKDFGLEDGEDLDDEMPL